MRTMLFALALWCLAAPLQAETGRVEIDADIHTQDLRARMLYLPDPKGIYTHESALARHDWRPLANDSLGYLSYPVWTQVTLSATDDKTHQLVLHNPRPNTNLIDVYLSSPDGGYTRYELGLLRPIANQPLKHRFTALPVTVSPLRPVTVIARVQSAGPVEAGWVLSTVGEFSAWTIREHLLRGAVAGAVLTMVLYNLILWLSLRQPVLLAYVAFGTLMQIEVFLYQGTYRIFDFGVAPFWFFEKIWPVACLMNAAMVTVAMYFFDTAKQMPGIHRWLKRLLMGLGSMFLWSAATLWDQELPRLILPMHLLFMVTYFSLFATGIHGVRRGLTGAVYYVAGHGGLLAALVLVQISVLGIFGSFAAASAAFPAGALLDIAFLAKAIGERLAVMKRELERQRENALVQSRFASLGKTIGMITHQWRTPLARQGAVLTELEMLLDGEARPTAYQRIKDVLLPRMQENLELLNDTVTDFRAYFASDKPARPFKPAEVIDRTLAIVAWQKAPGIMRVEWHPPSTEITLNGQPAALAHVLMIVLENARDIFTERHIAEPVLRITLAREQGAICIAVTDNGGGIAVPFIENIFSSFVSGKQHHGTGMGLYFARMLVQDRLRGRIEAHNTGDGACFSIILPE